MIFELDPDAWEQQARTVEALADALPAPQPLPLPHDRYARALGAVPEHSDDAAREWHAAAVAELRALAARIRENARCAAGTDRAAAERIEAVR
ncbi:hypothetical protein [Tsukamurella paurometabola]|uniref:Uncharacterized protein n=1 Tax=Tsukamurella paurometabola TaxID=2061 RepID=A0A3P8MF24_TSUPA|nr:hypothetical protein [Tsukamurella paurometabola]MBS4102327.1 hypothetical protein [Tsukamurella paurometabola]UEA84164.1 hypothetical protein LK411_04840 [Tsukamurella paurometabola]VDR41333.1 Uncharacterised protein [Tsukamurella paurometabola]